MKKPLILFLILTCTSTVFSQIRAFTENGEEVLLFDNGTWAFSNDSVFVPKEIRTNDTPFSRNKNLTFEVKSNKIDIGIWINPKEWTFTKEAGNDAAEYQFQKKNEDLYALLIAEKAEIPIEYLRDVAIQNAKNAAPDMKVLKEEYRTVNGKKILMMQMMGTLQGIKFMYFGYYYSYENGSVQLLTFTSLNLFEEYYDDMEEFLNGLDGNTK